MNRVTFGKLTIDVDGDQRERRATLSGRLDESSTLGPLVELLVAPRVVLDTAGIHFINSIGVREWIRLMRGLAAAGRRIVLVRVSEPLTAQLSMVLVAREGAEVVSVNAPYECAQCRREETVLVEIGPHRADLLAMRAPTFTCPECGGRLELADLPERYFLFVREMAAGH